MQSHLLGKKKTVKDTVLLSCKSFMDVSCVQYYYWLLLLGRWSLLATGTRTPYAHPIHTPFLTIA